MVKAKVFMGSSTEGLEIAYNIKKNLSQREKDLEVTMWNEGEVFRPGYSFLESLINAVDTFDFAILILSGDDLITSRGVKELSARDNTLFELGLFMGCLGRERTFFVYEKDNEKLKIPSDLSGIHCATYESPVNGNPEAAISDACTAILGTIRKEGARPPQIVKVVDSPYRITETLHILDMTGRVATGDHDLGTPFSEVVLYRHDLIQKQLRLEEDYVAFFGTTGLEIKLDSIKCNSLKGDHSPIKSEFTLRRKDNPFEDPLRKSYNLTLYTADRPAGDELEAISNFTFWNAFQTEDREWWSTDVKYPIDKAIVILKFPDDKPCTEVKLSVKTEGRDIEEIQDDPPIITKNGRYVYWTGINLVRKSKYIFQFRW
jgi:hypothetical protein